MIKRISVLISIIFLLNACGPSGMSETIASVNEMSQTAQAVATTIDVSGQATASAQATPVAEQSSDDSDRPLMLSELMYQETLFAFLNAQSSYTFSIQSDIDTDGSLTSTTYRETGQKNPEAFHLESISRDAEGNESVVTNTYTDTWYNVSDQGCQINTTGDEAFKMAMEMNRSMTLMPFMLPVSNDMDLLEEGEYNGTPAKHYSQKQRITIDAAAGSYMEYSAEWWVTEDNVVLWGKYINEVQGDTLVLMTHTYTLEQRGEPVTIETPSNCS